MMKARRDKTAKGKSPDCSPDCRRCRHFRITWQPALPYACRAYGFKGPNMPAVTVRVQSGRPCMLFEEKSPPVRGRSLG